MNNTPASTDLDRCPRCGEAFHCGAHESRCDCFEVRLSPALRAELAQRWSTCLCLKCLRALQQEAEAP